MLHEVRDESAVEARTHRVPIDDFKEGVDVIWAAVLVVEVVSVLPHVQAQDGVSTTSDVWHQGVVLVGAAAHLQLSVVYAKPSPPRAEAGRGRLGEGRRDRPGDAAGGYPGLRAAALPGPSGSGQDRRRRPQGGRVGPGLKALALTG